MDNWVGALVVGLILLILWSLVSYSLTKAEMTITITGRECEIRTDLVTINSGKTSQVIPVAKTIYVIRTEEGEAFESEAALSDMLKVGSRRRVVVYGWKNSDSRRKISAATWVD